MVFKFYEAQIELRLGIMRINTLLKKRFLLHLLSGSIRLFIWKYVDIFRCLHYFNGFFLYERLIN